MTKQQLIEQIRKADAVQIEDILDAAMCRKRELYPDWEILYYAYSKVEQDLAQERRQLAAWLLAGEKP